METEETEQMEEKPSEQFVSVKRSHLLSVVGAIIMISFFVFATRAVVANADIQQNNYITGQAAVPAAPIEGGKQIVKLSAQGLDYQPSPVVVKKGIPVELQVDTNSVKGCLRGIQIPAFGVRKLVTPTDNKIEFTPDKAGTFGFSCFMGMGKGQIVVQDENGNVPAGVNTVAQDIPKGASCGAGGGGCGCGGA